MQLYKINSAIESIIESEGFIDLETGEFLGKEDLEALQIDREEKILALGKAIKNLNAEAEAIKNEEKVLASRRKTTENKVENLKKYLVSCCSVGEKLKDSQISISIAKGRKSLVLDESLIPADYFKEEIVYKIDKDLIKEKLESGKEINGASFVVNPYPLIK